MRAVRCPVCSWRRHRLLCQLRMFKEAHPLSNDSTTPGYLTPVGDVPAYDQELELQISRWISGVTGMDPTLVYPGWTDPQPQAPASDTAWCTFDVATLPDAAAAASIQVSDEESEQWTWENVTVAARFYGPQAMSMSTCFRDGICVEQNQNALRSDAGLSLTGAGDITNQQESINNQWVRRCDITVVLSRKNTRIFNIKTLRSAPVQFFGD